MDDIALRTLVQGHFTDGLVFVIGSGLSVAEGLPGMPLLADHLTQAAGTLEGDDAAAWKRIEEILVAKLGLETALLRHQPSDTLQTWIARETTQFLLTPEQALLRKAIAGEHTLRLTTLLRTLRRPASVTILTTNYDRLVEVACELAGLHVDTTACGLYAGTFNHKESMMASCRGVRRSGDAVTLDHLPRAVVLKPHGSFDWYRKGTSALRCSIDLDLERAIITPGLNKYRLGYNAPFDKHRELANDHIRQAARLLIIGYGFNDDHLQTHLVDRINAGTPTIILTRTANTPTQQLVKTSPQCVCVTKPSDLEHGYTVLTKDGQNEHEGPDLWDLGVLASDCLT